MARWRSTRRARPVRQPRSVRSRSADRLRQFALIALAAVAIGAAKPAVGAPFDHEKLAETARAAYIVPGYARFAEALAALERTTKALCRAPSPENLAAIRAAYRGAIVAWGRVEIITFGPVRDENRFERIFFWPDRRSIGQRQVRAILREQDRSVIAPDRLGERSVAVQGLTALEMLLHGSGADQLAGDEPDNFRCAYALAIVQNLEAIVGAVRQGWQDDGAFVKLWRNPGPDNPTYLFASETTLELVKAFDQALENIRDRRIAPAIGFGPLRRKHRPVLWRSRLTMPLIHANLEGARDLLMTGGLAEAYMAARENAPEAAGDISSIASEFKLMLDRTSVLAGEADPFASGGIRRRLVAVGFPLKNIRTQAVGRLKQAAGLSVGFNASDGD